MISEVPAEIRETARRVFTSRDPSAQVLDLVADSRLTPAPPPGPRQLVFGAAPGPQVTVSVLDAGAGQVALEITSDPPGLEVLSVRSGDQSAPVGRSDGRHRTAAPLRHGLLVVVLALSAKRFRTAAVQV